MTEHLRGSHYGSSLPELRLVLLGTIGCGKTASGDTILGQLSPTSGDSRSCQLRQGFSEGRRLTLVEAPRWYWNGSHMEENVKKETERALKLVAPGPHAFLLLVPVGQFTEVEGCVPAELEEVFGEGALRHTLILLTCGDYLMGRTEQAYLQGEDPGLREIIECCGGRYHFINNRQRQDREQVRTLLEKVENMAQRNGGCYQKTLEELETERLVREREQALRELYRVKAEEKRETVEPQFISDTQRDRAGGEEYRYATSLERRREDEREEMDRRVSASQVANGLHSAPAPEPQSYSECCNDSTSQIQRSPSFKLNADGARLSQLSEVQPTKKVMSTFHHRINSQGGKSSPEVSPTSPPHSPVFSSFAASTSTSDSSVSSSSPELRLVLLGRSGAGKSAAGNTILGQEAFESYPDSLTSITQECEKKKALVAGRRVAVVDTPDWFKSEHSPDEVRAQISSCVALSSPGPHAFLLCVPVDQSAKTELQALGALEAVFGPEAVQTHTLILFTYADRLRKSGMAGENSVEAYIARQRGDLLKLVEKCGDRFHVMERGGGEGERRNVSELLEKVEQTVKEGGGQCYSCPAFQEAEERVRERQVEMAKERRERREQERLKDEQFGVRRQILHSSMQPLAEREEEEEEVREDEIEETRDEAERSVSTMNLESLPPISRSTMSPSFIRSVWEKMESGAKMVPKLLSDSSEWVGSGAKSVAASPMWGTVGSGAKNVQKMVVDSSVWGKMGVSAEQVSKLMADNAMLERLRAQKVPKLVVDGSTWVGSGAKRVAASPMWGTVGSGAKSGAKLIADGSMWVGSGAKSLAQSPMWGKVGSGAKSGAKIMADSSKRVGAGIGTGAKNLTQSPMWGKVGSGAKSGAKMVASGSMRVGAGIGAGAKKVAQSPVWEKVGSGAKAGAKMVAESSVWEKISTAAKKVPKVVIGGALLGLVLGVFLGGALGGAIGAAAGSAVTEVGRRKLTEKDTLKELDNAAKDAGQTVDDRVESIVKHGEKVLKAD
ncbi:uncharacterized protein LOC115367988 [Myripristis murdjan]|uniref:uncharacterized protein LOC115367988 n=1 Tax=Myripristis murdjan TaxID=586833 RepID=UPI00117633AC|nr:uncharacterized protein LOC115367988 [Myripristis murdjan]